MNGRLSNIAINTSEFPTHVAAPHQIMVKPRRHAALTREVIPTEDERRSGDAEFASCQDRAKKFERTLIATKYDRWFPRSEEAFKVLDLLCSCRGPGVCLFQYCYSVGKSQRFSNRSSDAMLRFTRPTRGNAFSQML